MPKIKVSPEEREAILREEVFQACQECYPFCRLEWRGEAIYAQRLEHGRPVGQKFPVY